MKNSVITVKLTADEHEEARKTAVALGTGLSGLVRGLLRIAADRVREGATELGEIKLLINPDGGSEDEHTRLVVLSIDGEVIVEVER